MIEITQAAALITGVLLGILAGDQVKLMLGQALNVQDWERRFGVRS